MNISSAVIPPTQAPTLIIMIEPKWVIMGIFIKTNGKNIIKVIIYKNLAQFLNIKIPINCTIDKI